MMKYSSNSILKCSIAIFTGNFPFTKNIAKEISQQKKLYFSDTGILNVLARTQLSSGQVFENAIAAQLKPIGSIQYYQRKQARK